MRVTYVTVVRFALCGPARHRCLGVVWHRYPEHTYDEYAPHAGVREAS
jgi:hypothetical protein